MFAKFAILLAVAQVATVALASAKEIPVEVSARLHFLETFDAGSDVFESGKWTRSSVDKYADQPVLIKTVQTPMPGFETDKGLELTQEHKYYGVSTRFPSPLSFTDFDTSKGQDFVVQYELKLEESLTCSGAYLKLPRVTEGLDLSIMDNNTPYTVMFGVDKCGTDTNKVHFILQFQNPLTGEWEEKHATEVPTPKLDKKSHLYTLLVTRGNNYEIFIDKKSAKKGSLFTHMKPSIAPPAEIPDPSDTKPSDWMDESTMPDPDAVKPDDWDESQPRKVPDAKATKPANWDEKAPRQIPDPSAIKPEDWDDGEDGEWEPPLVDNPACDNPGCGPWSPPLVSNPLYKGKWVPKNVPNPAYKGPWAQKNITNPGFYEVKDPYSSLPPVAGLAIEVLANNAGIHFDNLVVGRSLDAAFAVADSTFVPKSASEAVREKEKKKRKTEKKIKVGFPLLSPSHSHPPRHVTLPHNFPFLANPPT